MSHTISQLLVPEFDTEMANTRRTLEGVPDTHLAWRPHSKSMSMGQLASHLVNLTEWARVTLSQDDFDFNPPDGERFQPAQMVSAADNVNRFDDSVRQARALLETATDDTMMRPWTLKNHGAVVFSLPKAAVWRSFVMNHIVHHRAQLGVYLRLNDRPVPGFYGPSADEQ